jgi:SAM-dependent methyltransferase
LAGQYPEVMTRVGELKSKATQYSKAFDGASPLANEENRARKAAMIRAVLVRERALDRDAPRILDIGCAFGLILEHLTPSDGFGVGVDMDTELGRKSPNLAFARTDAEKLPFKSSSFDVVICNHVYEHTDNASRLVSEIHRVMVADGACYFAGPNKYELIEPHYGLPLLSWLPRSIADRYMRVTRKGDSYPEKPFSRRRLHELLRRFEVTDYTQAIVSDPERYEATDILPPGSLKLAIARGVLRLAPFFFPGFVYVLRKRPEPV